MAFEDDAGRLRGIEMFCLDLFEESNVLGFWLWLIEAEIHEPVALTLDHDLIDTWTSARSFLFFFVG